MVVRWTFEDQTVPETYTFHVNPNDGGSPGWKKSITYQNTSAPDGKTLVFEGLPEIQELEFSGIILEEAHYNAFLEWWEKKRQVLLTDDLGREMWIYITAFEPKRIRRRSHPWAHEYTVRATILSWE